MKVSGDVLFRNHVHTFRSLFTNHTYRAQQMTKIIDQVRIQLNRKRSFDVAFLQRNTTNIVELLVLRFWRRYLKRSRMFFRPRQHHWHGRLAPQVTPFARDDARVDIVILEFSPYTPTAVLGGPASEPSARVGHGGVSCSRSRPSRVSASSGSSAPWRLMQ